MSFTLRASEPVTVNVRRMARDRLDDAVEDLEAAVRGEAVTGGFAKTYGRCRKRLADVREDPTTASLHEWRKRVKYHRYHLRILEPLWPGVWGARREEVHDLSDLLGDDHDLAVLRGVFASRPDLDDEAVRTLAGVMDRRRAEMQREAIPPGERLFALPPDAMVDQLEACWHAWTQEAALPVAPEPLTLAASA